MIDIDRIPDDAMIPMKLVRVLIEEARRESAVTWLRLPEAAAVLGCKADTLRARCGRWNEAQRPAVRVRKLGSGACSHWLLAECDVIALAGSEGKYARVESAGKAPSVQADAKLEEDAMIDHWCRIATKNL